MSEKIQAPYVGLVVWYIDEQKREHLALVTEVWGQIDKDMPAVNLAFVSPEEEDRNQYGRSILRRSSVVFVDSQPAGANFWDHFAEECA